MSDDRKDLPPANSPQFLERMREFAQTYLGNRGDKLNRGLTVRDLADAGVQLNSSFLNGQTKSNPIAGFAPTYAADLTAPPSPSGFTATAGLTQIYILQDSPQYFVGHGHSHSVLYGTTSSTPAFANAVVLGEFTGDVFTLPSDMSRAWHLWLTWVSVDGTESTVPAGGINGVSARTGQIGNADLGDLIIEARNIAHNGITYDKINARNLSILDADGVPVFSSDGKISSNAYIDLNGNNVAISDIAAGNLVASTNFVGTYASAPTAVMVGSQWRQNAIYRNSTNGMVYILTGNPLAWMLYIEDGFSFILTIESTNGTAFRVGGGTSTTLIARLFKNGADVTDVTPAGWFRWRRVSAIPQSSPNDDATWNALYAAGYKQVSISVDSVYARATFFCDILS
jgi:hypothetical protein